MKLHALIREHPTYSYRRLWACGTERDWRSIEKRCIAPYGHSNDWCINEPARLAIEPSG